MQKIIIFFCLFLGISSFAQIIRGKITDLNKQPLYGANVYFDGTTIATTSDENGDFILNYSSKINSVLVISFIGYQTQYITSIGDNNELKIILQESINTLNEVIISKDKFTREQKIQLFREQFLGMTALGKNSIIENEDDINFDYDERKFIIKANSNSPLIVKNVTLGYKITYELINFEVKFFNLSVNSKNVIKSFYSGVSRFEEIDNNDKIIKKRQKCYQGSQLHFFRNLANNIWNKNNFLLFLGSFQENPNDYFIISDENDAKKIIVKRQTRGFNTRKFVATFNLLFNKREQSKIIFETDTFFIDKYGNNSNINEITFSGKLSEQRVGDMLPLNYN